MSGSDQTRNSPAPVRMAAKLVPPRLRFAYPRRELFSRLDHPGDASVVWIQGPPGAGKTTLVAKWREQAFGETVWMRCDAADGDAGTFFHYLADAAGGLSPAPLVPSFAQETLPTLTNFAQAFLRGLCAGRRTPLRIVLDDYHTIPVGSPVHLALAEASLELPEGALLIIISRLEPPPGWAKQCAYTGLALIQPSELRLTAVDCEAIMALRGHTADADKALMLCERAEGWAAGVVSLLESGTKSHVTEAVLFDLFAQEVIARLSKDAQSVLLATAGLVDFTDQLARELSGIDSASAILGSLAERDYFVYELTGTPRTFRYHPMFGDFLRRLALQEYGPARVRDFQIRAARCLGQAGRLDEALFLAEEAEAWDVAEHLILANAAGYISDGRAETLRDVIARLPRQRVDERPELLSWYARALLIEDADQALANADRAYALFASRKDSAGQAWSWCLAAQASLWGFERMLPSKWIERFDEITQGLDQMNAPPLELALAEAAVGVFFHTAYSPENYHRWEQRAFALALKHAGERLAFPMARQLLFSYGWWGTNLAGARQLIDAFSGLVRSEDIDPSNGILWLISESQFHLYRANFAAAVDSAQRGLDWSARCGLHLWDPMLMGTLFEVDVQMGHIDSAEMRLGILNAMTSVEETPRLLRSLQHDRVARLAILNGDDPARAWSEYRLAAEILDQVTIPPAMARASVAWALAADAGGIASPSISDALSVCRRWGYEVGEFVCRLRLGVNRLRSGQGEPARAEIASALALGRRLEILTYPGISPQDWQEVAGFAVENAIEPEYAAEIQTKRLAGVALRSGDKPPTISSGTDGPSTNPLSNRQTEVLRLVAAGKTAWEISQILKISERTVKFHLSSTCTRLDVARTKQAIAIAAANGWLSPQGTHEVVQ